MDMKRHINMSMLYNKIEIKIDINDDELLETISGTYEGNKKGCLGEGILLN